MAICSVVLLYASPSYANTQPQNRGLYLTPIREYVNVDAGKAQDGTLTIANITDNPAVVTMSVEQFSVVDYTYNYTFMPTKEDWIKLQTTQVKLNPGKSQTIPYTIAPPKGATPGGHYFTLFASTSLVSGAISSKVRAASVLYVTVDGPLKKTSEIRKESIPFISFGGDIDFMLDVKNTGNTHFFIYTSGKLSGWSARPDGEEVTHVLLPGTTRTTESTIPAPLLPGVYTATYGYKTDDGHTVNHSRPVLYLPLWFLAAFMGVGWVGLVIRKRQKRFQKKAATDSSQRLYK